MSEIAEIFDFWGLSDGLDLVRTASSPAANAAGIHYKFLAERLATRQGIKVHQKIKGLANNPMKPNVCPTLGGGENTNQTKSFAGAGLPAEEETCNKSLVSENIVT